MLNFASKTVLLALVNLICVTFPYLCDPPSTAYILKGETHLMDTSKTAATVWCICLTNTQHLFGAPIKSPC